MHLEVGSQADNALDMVIRGRSLRGEKAPCAILTEQQVLQVFGRLEAGEMHKAIAASFGVSRAAISQIAAGKNWAWLRRMKDAA